MDELAQIDNHIGQIDQDLKQLDHQIRLLKKHFDVLSHRATRLRDRRQQLTTSVPWIDRLPSDILARIMLLGTQAIGRDVDLRRDRVMLPTAVSQVSHRWRKVAVQSPSLWTYINMQEGRPYDRTISWLKRSRGAPLDIDLDYRDQPKEAYYQRNFLITLNVLIPFIYRWGSIRIIAPTALLETALHVFSAPAPILHTLILKGWSTAEDDAEEHWSPTIFCRHTPRLQVVQLHAISLRWDTCIFSDLRDLTLSYIPHDTVYDLKSLANFLRVASPCLQRLSIVGSTPTSMPRSDPDANLRTTLPLQVKLPRLHELRLESLNLLDLQTLIPLLYTPYLRKLTISKVSGGGQETWRKSRWRPELSHLDHLELSNVEFAGGFIEAICSATPNVSRLTLKGPSANEVLEYLTPEPLLMLPEEEMFLPDLERLEIHDGLAESVRAFVESRTASLREVKGSIINDRKVKKSADGLDAIKQLGWQHNDAIHVALRPVGQ